jgi:hypothetical protein
MLLYSNTEHIRPEHISYEAFEDINHRKQTFIQAYEEEKCASC